MFPPSSRYYVTDGFRIHPIFSSKLGVDSSPINILGSDFPYLVCSKFSSFDSFASSYSSPIFGVSDIVSLSSWNEMARIATVGVITRMSKNLSFRQTSSIFSIHQTMYEKMAVHTVQRPIAMAVSLTKPNPTIRERGFDNKLFQIRVKLSKKIICNSFIGNHKLSIPSLGIDAIGIVKCLKGKDLCQQ